MASFNQLVAVAPRAMPQLWQRGIALYYAGRYDDCRKQFEAHRTVNPDDVENAAWHFLCVARAESPARARAALLPVGPTRACRCERCYELFRGKMTPEQVLPSGGLEPERPVLRPSLCRSVQRGHWRRRRGRVQLETAASDRFRSAGGYMHMVARVHVARLSGYAELVVHHRRDRAFEKMRFAHGLKTPMLIIHSDRYYRVPVAQGLQCHGVLKAKGVPARLVPRAPQRRPRSFRPCGGYCSGPAQPCRSRAYRWGSC